MSCPKSCMVLILLVALSASCATALTVGFYNQTCPNAEQLVRQVVTRAYNNNSGAAPGLIRMFFHDCFVRGCDGSVLIDSTPNNTAEKDSPANNPSLRFFKVIDAAKAAVEAECPQTVSCADILAFAARDSSYLAGDISYQVPAGRRDGRISRAMEALIFLPASNFTAARLVANFEKKHLTPEDLVILSGAHSIGNTHCHPLLQRLYHFNTTSGVDPTLSSAYAELLKMRCPVNVPSMDKRTVSMDIITPDVLDNRYYVGLTNNLGLLGTDHALVTDATLAAVVNESINNGTAWAVKFALAMGKMGQIQVKEGSEGEIRINCRVINNVTSASMVETQHGYDHASS